MFMFEVRRVQKSLGGGGLFKNSSLKDTTEIDGIFVKTQISREHVSNVT
jgi:hypothetical protein